jgi:hypothetical protein
VEVLVAVERLLLKVRQPRSRADELIALRARLRMERASEPSPEELALAREVRAGKLAVAGELTAVASCGTCATGARWQASPYAGGDCCSGVTENIFDEGELAALAHAGTRARDLTPPRGAEVHAGCAFRGARGCNLEVAHRPARCVHYCCDILRREIHARGRLDVLEATLADLDHLMQRFTAAHQARVNRDVLAPLIDGVASARSR